MAMDCSRSDSDSSRPPWAVLRWSALGFGLLLSSSLIAAVDPPTAPPSDADAPGEIQDGGDDVTAPPPGEDAGKLVADSEPAAPPRRVHLIIDRHSEIGGVVVSDELDEITIRVDGDGEVRTFAKPRVLTIVELVEPEPGQNGSVLLRSGETFRGTIIEDAFDGVTMQIAGIRSFHPRASVLRTRLEDSSEVQYRRLRKQIPEADHVRRLALCQWLFDRRMYSECLDELDDLLEAFDLGEAHRLKRLVQAQLALESDSLPTGIGARPHDALDDDDDTARGPISLRDLLPNRLLTTEDVNMIRVFEIDFRRPPRVSIDQAAIRRLIEENASHPAIPATSEGRTRMFRADPIDLVRVMFELKARDLYSEIEVESEPYALNLFRRKVHDAWLIGNCATSRCHGGLDGGGLFLHNRNSRDERVRFTNLLILLRSELGPQPLVNFERPRDSLIIQHALPRSEARFPHPDVPGWKPVFTNANTRLLSDSLRWIESMYLPRPSYPVEYEPPDLRPRIDPSATAEEPAAGPTR